MVISLLLLTLSMYPGEITFLSTYPTEYFDFVRSVIELPDEGYMLFGSTDSPFSQGSRIILTDEFGECILDSLPPCTHISGCLSPDSCITSVFVQMNALVLQKRTVEGIEYWTKEYPEYSEFSPLTIISCSDGGYIVLSATESGESTSSAILKTDENGEFQWLTTLEDSSPTGISEGEDGSLITCMLYGTGGRITTLSSTGQLLNQFVFPDNIFRDTIFWNGAIAAAAVEDGILCIDTTGVILWNFNPTQSVEVYSLTESGDNNLAGAGSILTGSENRSYLVKLDSNGSLLWENSFGFGDSFRSIFLTLCEDGGFCSAGGYIDESSMRSFLIRTDSLGMIEPQGIEPGEVMPDQPGLFRIANPVFGSTVSLYLLQTTFDYIDLTVMDLHGRVLEKLRVIPDDTHDRMIELRGLETGKYFIVARTSDVSDALILTVLRGARR